MLWANLQMCTIGLNIQSLSLLWQEEEDLKCLPMNQNASMTATLACLANLSEN